MAARVTGLSRTEIIDQCGQIHYQNSCEDFTQLELIEQLENPEFIIGLLASSPPRFNAYEIQIRIAKLLNTDPGNVHVCPFTGDINVKERRDS